MHSSKFDARFAHWLAIAALVLLALMPFHAILTVWLSQALGHYTALRLWKETLLLPLALGALYLLIKNPKVHQQVAKVKLTPVIIAYLCVQLIWGAVAYLTHHVTAKALGYGLVVNTRFLIFFLAVWIIAAQAPKLQAAWQKVVFWPAAIVATFGLLQYFVLPYDFLKHLGYNSATIFPYEDINHNIHYLRAMSTLRGANPLGAYLVVILSLLLAVWQKQRNWWYAALAAAGVLTLVLSFSRAAWLGSGVSIILLLWLSLKKKQGSPKQVLIGVVVCLVIISSAVLALHHNPTFQNIFFHTEEHSAIKTTSNEGHASALQNGLRETIHEPLGRGPGTAGPASVYNAGHPSRIAENYYVQIAQETGWLGLILFVAIILRIAKELWRCRNQALALGLLAALAGICVVNLFSHAWADDTLAYLWWGLAGIALAPLLAAPESRAKA